MKYPYVDSSNMRYYALLNTILSSLYVGVTGCIAWDCFSTDDMGMMISILPLLVFGPLLLVSSIVVLCTNCKHGPKAMSLSAISSVVSIGVHLLIMGIFDGSWILIFMGAVPIVLLIFDITIFDPSGENLTTFVGGLVLFAILSLVFCGFYINLS